MMQVLRDDVRFRPIVEVYALDQELWFADFASAFKRITELGLPEHLQQQKKSNVVE